jgi:hypothetical protein
MLCARCISSISITRYWGIATKVLPEVLFIGCLVRHKNPGCAEWEGFCGGLKAVPNTSALSIPDCGLPVAICAGIQPCFSFNCCRPLSRVHSVVGSRGCHCSSPFVTIVPVNVSLISRLRFSLMWLKLPWLHCFLPTTGAYKPT